LTTPIRSLLLLAFAFAVQAVNAEQHEIAEIDFFGDTPLVLTSSRMAKPLDESPASITIISRQMIESSGVRKIAELFKLVPGFVVGYHNGHVPTVSYHGMGKEFARKIQVLIDGRSVFIPSFGGVPWSNLPLLLQDIERIEIIRGPNAVTYGANAFLATINIISRDAAEDVGAHYTITSSDNANPDIKDAYLRLAGQNDNFDWRVSLGAISDDGFSSVNDSKESAKANFRVDFKTEKNQFWTVQGGTSSSTAGLGFTDADTDIERDEEADNSYINIHWEGIWGSSTSSARLTQTRQEVVDNFDPGPLTLDLGGLSIPGVTTFVDFGRVSDRTDLEVIQSHDLSESLRLVFGANFRKDKVRSLFLLNTGHFEEVNSKRIFGSFEWRPDESWLVDVGMMSEDSNITTTEHSPRISIINKLNHANSLRFVVSEAKRNPILWEYKGMTVFPANATIPPFGNFDFEVQTWQGNDDIEPEEIRSYELGLRSRFRNHSLATDIKLFSYKVENNIVETKTLLVQTLPIVGAIPVETVTAINADVIRVKGIEVAIDYTPNEGIELHAGFSIPQVESSRTEFEQSIPDYTAFLHMQRRLNQKHEISATYYYIDEISWLDTFEVIPPSRRLDFRYLFNISNENKIELIGQNLLKKIMDYEPENIHDRVVYLRYSGSF
jgi:iron complex outermembrane receptor protein